MSKLHIFGFKDWCAPKSSGLIPNPARLLVEEVAGNSELRDEIIRSFGGKIDQVVTSILPVPTGADVSELFATFRQALLEVLSTVDLGKDYAISFGQGNLTSGKPVLEASFKNRFKTRDSTPIALNPDESFDLQIGLGELAKGISTGVEGLGYSEDADTYYCNALGFITFSQFPLNRSLFVHLPGLPSSELAQIIWHANQEQMRGLGINSAVEMPYATLDQNVEMLKKLVSVWRSFEL